MEYASKNYHAMYISDHFIKILTNSSYKKQHFNKLFYYLENAPPICQKTVKKKKKFIFISFFILFHFLFYFIFLKYWILKMLSFSKSLLQASSAIMTWNKRQLEQFDFWDVNIWIKCCIKEKNITNFGTGWLIQIQK